MVSEGGAQALKMKISGFRAPFSEILQKLVSKVSQYFESSKWQD